MILDPALVQVPAILTYSFGNKIGVALGRVETITV